MWVLAASQKCLVSVCALETHGQPYKTLIVVMVSTQQLIVHVIIMCVIVCRWERNAALYGDLPALEDPHRSPPVTVTHGYVVCFASTPGVIALARHGDAS